MIIREMIINGFGRHCGLKLEPENGVNVICGDNESGKSTAAAFIRAMLYGLSDKGDQSERKKYRPWQAGVKYGGELRFEHRGIFYRVTAQFGESRNDDVITLYNDTTGEILPTDAGKTVGEMILEIPQETYDLSVYAAQLSSKPNSDSGNMDYLFDRLVKKSDSMKQTSSDITVGKRIKAAMDSISSPRNDEGTLDILQAKKSETDAAVKRIYDFETRAESLREEHSRLRGELDEIKKRHTSEKKDITRITSAVNTIALHGEIKEYISKINECDEDLTYAARRRSRIRKPATVIFIILILLCALCAIAVAFYGKLSGISFLQGIELYRKAAESKVLSYITIGSAAAATGLIYMFVFSVGSSDVIACKEDMYDLEEELCGVLGIKYAYGDGNHSYNRDNINEELQKHSREYKEAKAYLDGENNKDAEDKKYMEDVEDYTQRIAYALASADALSKAADETGDCEELAERSAELSESINIYKERMNALRIANDVLGEAYKRWQADLGPVFGNEAGVILGKLTGGRYNDLRVARNFEITLRSRSGGDRSGDLYGSYVYSGATVDQMYLALRLALVKIISQPGGMLPLILDDPFVQYDMRRKQNAYRTVSDFTRENNSQIIMTACRGDSFPEDFNVMMLGDA